MNNNDSFGRKVENFLTGKGFYIVLLACVCVIGISAWSLINAGVFSTDDSPVIDIDAPDVGNNSVNNVKDKINSTIIEDDENDVSVNGTEDDISSVNSSNEEEDTVETAAELTFVKPLEGEVSYGYSPDELIFNPTMSDWRVHTGIDFLADEGAEVCAVADGTVKEIYTDDLMGTTMVIDHGNGIVSIYSNLAEETAVMSGETVKAGDVIGTVGNTAIGESKQESHLHFSMKKDDEYCDPFEYIPQ